MRRDTKVFIFLILHTVSNSEIIYVIIAIIYFSVLFDIRSGRQLGCFDESIENIFCALTRDEYKQFTRFTGLRRHIIF